MLREIGSEFWLEKIPIETNRELPTWLTGFGETVLTSSCRGAISLLLQQITPKNKTALLPEYICESVIIPFIENGYICYFYEIDECLSPKVESIKSNKNIGVFLHLGYFGFPTNSNLWSVLQELKDDSTIIVEDSTHSLFSKFRKSKLNDYYVGSIRKWFGIPSGGFLASANTKIKIPLINNDSLVNLRTMALLTKWKYMETGDGDLKELFLKQFSEAEELLDRDTEPYCIDGLSLQLINSLDHKNLIRKRRENFNVLLEGLRKINYLNPIFDTLPESGCPLFFPIMINCDRNQIRKILTKEKIYCPIHWPIPIQINKNIPGSTLATYNSILSIPCDQRYGIKDMERIISVLKVIKADVLTMEH